MKRIRHGDGSAAQSDKLPAWAQTFRDRLDNKTLEEIAAPFRSEKFQHLSRRYRDLPHNPLGPAKYFDVPVHLPESISKALMLGLHRTGHPGRVFDVGCGFGYFLHVARALGHDIMGLDFVDGNSVIPMGGNKQDAHCYTEVTSYLRIPRVLHEIRAMAPLPHSLLVSGTQFDMITAFQITFDLHSRQNLRWRVPEWEYFLNDLRELCNPDYRLVLEFNRGEDGDYMPDALRDFFLSLGATTVGERTVTFEDASGAS